LASEASAAWHPEVVISFRSNAFLPAGGAGLRFMLSKTYHVNLRADLAAGKNEHTFSMGVSEAF